MNIRKISLVLLLGIFSCHGKNNDKPLPGGDKDLKMNTIRLKDLNGQSIDLETYKGKTIFINFWATWCQPCVEEMPSIERAQNILKDKAVVFLLASRETPEEIGAFRTRHKYKLNFVLVENSEELDIPTLPTTFIFNPKGKLVYSEMGMRQWDEKNNIDMIQKITNEND